MSATQNQAISLIADVCILAGDDTLLVRYSNPENFDGQSGWFLPDDQMHHVEHPDKAAARILQEQVGLSGEPRLNHIESFVGNDRSWHLAFHYVLRLDDKPAVQAGEGVEARWFALDALPPAEEVAHHGWALGNIRRILAAE